MGLTQTACCLEVWGFGGYGFRVLGCWAFDVGLLGIQLGVWAFLAWFWFDVFVA